MLTRAEIKWLHGLTRKRQRDAEGLFIAEGPKVVGDLLALLPCRLLLATADFLQSKAQWSAAEVRELTASELARVSLLQAPQQVVAVFEKPTPVPWQPTDELALALDGVQDPGNVGTIIRLADWFGIHNILCSRTTADAFAPKVVQATMGALGRINLHYVDLCEALAKLPVETPIYGTFLDGSNIYEQTLDTKGLIIMGNEGQGISPAVERFVSKRLFIPRFPLDATGSESLNVAMATAIICAEFRRRNY